MRTAPDVLAEVPDRLVDLVRAEAESLHQARARVRAASARIEAARERERVADEDIRAHDGRFTQEVSSYRSRLRAIDERERELLELKKQASAAMKDANLRGDRLRYSSKLEEITRIDREIDGHSNLRARIAPRLARAEEAIARAESIVKSAHHSTVAAAQAEIESGDYTRSELVSSSPSETRRRVISVLTQKLRDAKNERTRANGELLEAQRSEARCIEAIVAAAVRFYEPLVRERVAALAPELAPLFGLLEGLARLMPVPVDFGAAKYIGPGSAELRIAELVDAPPVRTDWIEQLIERALDARQEAA
jgi:hypothetical protein